MVVLVEHSDVHANIYIETMDVNILFHSHISCIYDIKHITHPLIYLFNIKCQYILYKVVDNRIRICIICLIFLIENL